MNKVKKNNYKKWDKISNGDPRGYFAKLWIRYIQMFNKYLECDLCSTTVSDMWRKQCPHCGRNFLYHSFNGMRRLKNAHDKFYKGRYNAKLHNELRAHRDE